MRWCLATPAAAAIVSSCPRRWHRWSVWPRAGLAVVADTLLRSPWVFKDKGVQDFCWQGVLLICFVEQAWLAFAAEFSLHAGFWHSRRGAFLCCSSGSVGGVGLCSFCPGCKERLSCLCALLPWEHSVQYNAHLFSCALRRRPVE